MRWLVLAIAIAGCGPSGNRTVWSPPPRMEPSVWQRALVAEVRAAGCDGAAIHIEAGEERGVVCPDEARELGLTIIDLADAWTPSLFAPRAEVTPAFRETYLKLAAEHDHRGKPIDGAAALGELYGVVPSLAIVRERLADDLRHTCHAQIDSAPITRLDRPFGQRDKLIVRRANQLRRALAAELERERADRGLFELAFDPRFAATYQRWQQLDAQHRGLVAAQHHLVCEGFLPATAADGNVTRKIGNAVDLFQRRNFLMPNRRLDPETREALATDSRELDFRLALRILRERVVDASGLIEDGTAGLGPVPILGRMLDPAEMRAARGRDEPLPNAAPDLIGPATEVAAKQLGWTGPAEVAAFLAQYPEGVRVAIALPPLPAYHAPHMELSAEIDRGDVWYDAVPKPRRVARRPTLVLYVDDRGTRRPLIRWPTTIGGWNDVRDDNGRVHRRWKESSVGPRVWRELYAAPTWLPPPSTPDRELGQTILGPGPRGAYGVMMLVHHRTTRTRDDASYHDGGIRTHGSASVTSVVHGTSHGCHRLYNHLAVRLGDFLLRHRTHEVKGQQATRYRRVIRHERTFTAKVDTRGFLYELTPPVPIEVLPGDIKTARKVPPRNAAPARR